MASSVNDFYLKEPVGKLILKFAVPSITALLVSSLYNIVDQIFIGNGVGYLGNAATNVVYPITIIAQAIALLIGDGCAAYLSICQGRKDSENAQKSVGNALTLMIISAAAVFLFFFLTRNSILWLFGATENNIGYTKDYFAYILLGMPFFMLGGALPCIIRADGSPRFAMAATLVGCVINVILDPIAIFVLDMGVKGAAIATALGQIVSAVMCVWYLFHARSFRLTKSDLVLKASVLKKTLPLGISSFLTQISIMVNMTVMNNVLVKYGAMSRYGADIPLSVVGIVQKVFGIMIAVTVGIAAGSQPIVGYNYGAREQNDDDRRSNRWSGHNRSGRVLPAAADTAFRRTGAALQRVCCSCVPCVFQHQYSMLCSEGYEHFHAGVGQACAVHGTFAAA